MTRPIAGVALVTVLAAGGACGGGQPAMTRDQARGFTARALADAGLAGVDVAPEVRLETCGEPAQESWQTTGRAPGGGTVELCVPLRGDRAVHLRDVGPGGVGPLLTDAQFERLERFRHDPVASRRRGDVVRAGPPAAALVALVAYALLRLGRRRAGAPGQ